MKITVLSGSPKGEYSITLQYLKVIEKTNPNIVFDIYNVGEKIALIEKNGAEFDNIIKSVGESSGVIWVFPVYHFTVPAQLMRFIELVSEKKCESVFAGKYSASIITSIHFFDTLAEDYIRGVSEDLEMKYLGGFLAEMNDIKKPEIQKKLVNFGKILAENIENNKIVSRVYGKSDKNKIKYEPENIQDITKQGIDRIILITDSDGKNANLDNMIDVYVKTISCEVEVINLNNIETKGGCLGCCSCAFDGECVYKDQMSEFLKRKYVEADAIVIASEIRARYFGSKIKRMYDRSFMYGHRPILSGKKILYLISGNLSENPVVKNEIDARSAVGETVLIDVITDEFESGEQLTRHIEQAGAELIKSIEKNENTVPNFYQVAGQKIFRDFIYKMKGIFVEDHKYYKKINYYDFPQKDIKTRAGNMILSLLMKSKKVRDEFKKRTKYEMVKGIKKETDKIEL